MKIEATRVLMENAANTFVTPVFNGSTSLRDAAGQMIENVAKSVRRKETIDDSYMEKLFSDVMALYHLDQLGGVGGAEGGKDLGPLPTESRTLLIVLGIAWAGICAVALHDELKKRQK